MDDEEYIAHYGVKGMRWGVRNKRRSSSKRSESAASRAKRLSEDDLKNAIRRMELEKKYTELSNGKKTTGKKYAKSLLESSGRTVVGAVVGATATKLVQKHLKD